MYIPCWPTNSTSHLGGLDFEICKSFAVLIMLEVTSDGALYFVQAQHELKLMYIPEVS